VQTDFLSVTELAGDDVTQEQLERLCHRYYWAGTYCKDKDVLEVACGTGQGLGYLARLARNLSAGDYSEAILNIARSHYGNRIDLKQFDAQQLPFADNTMDVIILFEAIYYIASAEKFVADCSRILRPGGKVLIATANKDLFDFNPSPYSHTYYGVVELNKFFSQRGFSVELFGYFAVDELTLRQKILRPMKRLAIYFGLIPRTMHGKKLLKTIVFGKLVKMPAEIDEGIVSFTQPIPLPIDRKDYRHKVLYCVATLQQK